MNAATVRLYFMRVTTNSNATDKLMALNVVSVLNTFQLSGVFYPIPLSCLEHCAININ